MPKVFIFIKENPSSMPPQFMLDAINDRMVAGDILIGLDKNYEDLRPMVKNANYEVLYENGNYPDTPGGPREDEGFE